jgi:hypothetical protein
MALLEGHEVFFGWVLADLVSAWSRISDETMQNEV